MDPCFSIALAEVGDELARLWAKSHPEFRRCLEGPMLLCLGLARIAGTISNEGLNMIERLTGKRWGRVLVEHIWEQESGHEMLMRSNGESAAHARREAQSQGESGAAAPTAGA